MNGKDVTADLLYNAIPQMTTIAAIKNKHTNEIVLCHDGRISTTQGEIISENAKKIIVFNHFALLWCGSEHLKDLVSFKYRDLFNSLIIEDEEDVLWFYQIYFDNVLNDSTVKATEKDGQSRHTADYIIITPNNIYEINTFWELWGSDLRQKRYDSDIRLAVAGSGWAVCQHWIEWYLENTNIDEFSNEQMASILKLGAEYVWKRMSSCNSNITLYKVSDLFIWNTWNV